MPCQYPSHRASQFGELRAKVASVDQAKDQLELADGRWESAIREHAQPPPDAGFALPTPPDARAREHCRGPCLLGDVAPDRAAQLRTVATEHLRWTRSGKLPEFRMPGGALW